MSASSLRLSLCFVLLAGLAGCGGGSNGGSTGGGASPTTVTFTFTGPAPVAIATQIGTGAYAPATLTGGKLTIDVPSGGSKFAVAYRCPLDNSTQADALEIIREASILDGTSFSADCLAGNASAPQTGLATLQVNAAAIPGAEWVLAGGEGLQWSGSTLDFSEQTTAGTYDVPVIVSSGGAPPAVNNLLAIRILRAQTIPGALNGGAPLVFAAGDEFTPETIAYNNLPSGYAINYKGVTFETAGGTYVSLENLGPATQYVAVPQASVRSGDSYQFYITASNPVGGGTLLVESFTSSGGPQTFTFPAPWTYAGPTAAALPTFNFAYSGFTGTSNPSDFAQIFWSPAVQATDAITVDATANYQNGSTAVSIPDLSGLTGFLASPASGATVNWYATLAQRDPFFTATPSGTIQSVINSGSYTEP